MTIQGRLKKYPDTTYVYKEDSICKDPYINSPMLFTMKTCSGKDCMVCLHIEIRHEYDEYYKSDVYVFKNMEEYWIRMDKIREKLMLINVSDDIMVRIEEVLNEIKRAKY